MDRQKVYVSVTGLRLKAPWHAPRFWWHAIGSMSQARSASGNLSTETRTIDGVHHTLSIWDSDVSMRAFLSTGRHRQAMRAFRSMSTGRVYGFWSDEAPEWEAALRLWRDHGRDV